MRLLPVVFILGHTLFNSFAQVCLKFAAAFEGAGQFVLWQLIGNTSAFVGTLSYTASMRWLPLHIAYPITQGLSLLVFTFFGSFLYFQETIRPLQWLGIVAIIAGIVIIGATSRAEEATAPAESQA